MNQSQLHTSPLRILWVVSKFQRQWMGGIGRIIAEGSKALVARGHEVHVAGSAPSGEPGELPWATTHPWPARRHKFDQLWPLLRLVREVEPDVVHFHSAAPHGSVILPLLFLRGKKKFPAILLTPHSAPRIESPDFFSRVVYRHVDGVTASSPWSADQVRPLLKNSNRVRAIFNGIDLPQLDLVDERKPFLLSISSLSFRKGLDVLIEAFSLIAAAHPQWTLRIAGSGSQEEALHALVKSKSCSNQIEFLGATWGAEKEKLLRTASIGVVPSRHDNLPGTLMEFQAYGVPAVATQVGGIPNLAEDGKLSKLVAPNNPVELARALEELVNDAILRSRLAQDARAASSHRSWENFAAAHEAFYREILSEMEQSSRCLWIE